MDDTAEHPLRPASEAFLQDGLKFWTLVGSEGICLARGHERVDECTDETTHIDLRREHRRFLRRRHSAIPDVRGLSLELGDLR